MANEDEMLPSTWEYSSDVSTQDAPPPLPARTYPAVCSAAKAHRSKTNPDNVMVSLEFTIDPSAYPADYTATTEATKLYHIRTRLNDDSARGRFQLRRLCETMRVHVSRSLDLNDFVGKQANLKIKHGSWEGIPRAEIDAIEPA